MYPFMRAFTLVAALILTAGVLLTANHPSARKDASLRGDAPQSWSAIGAIGRLGTTSAVAAYPDHGTLLAYDGKRKVVRTGASTWHPVLLSETHALRAIAEGEMAVPAPNGQTVRLRYERHFEHSDGNWTWIGREVGSAPGTEAVLTFGEKAVFGTIRQANADLSLTTEAGSTWLVETDYNLVDRNRVAASSDDFAVPAGKPQAIAASALASLQAAGAPVEQVNMSAAGATVSPTVDIVMGFTTGFATRLGGESQARTRLNFLVDTANTAYAASGITAQIRLVHAMQVDYPDGTVNFSALFDLTGVNCTEEDNGAQYMSSSRWTCTAVSRPAALQPLGVARETHGADLLVLVRKFEATSESCGMAWMLGGGQNPIDASSSAYGMTVVNDTSGVMFPDNDITCPDWQLAHELGHNMGQQHDRVTAMETDDSDNNGNLLDPEEFGRHPYSFGHSTDGTAADVATIMSNRRPSQTRYRVFANPLITACGGAPCGIADQADNARSMSETMPIVAAFRYDLVPAPHLIKDINGDGRADIFWRNQGLQQADWWYMNGAVRSFGGSKGAASQYRVAGRGDFDGDGRSDVLWEDGATIWLWRSQADGGFAVQFVANHPGNGWTIAGVEDLNGDGRVDLFWSNRTLQRADWWHMNGATKSFAGSKSVPAQYHVAGVGDFTGDGRSDVLWEDGATIWLWRAEPVGGFSVHFVANHPANGWAIAGIDDLNGDNQADIFWSNRTLQRADWWHMNGASWSFAGTKTVPSQYWVAGVGDFDGDGRSDVLWEDGSTIWLWRSQSVGGFLVNFISNHPANGWAIAP